MVQSSIGTLQRNKGRCLVTGVAGFIGSHLAERLIDEGYSVRGVDGFTDYYPREWKERNLVALKDAEGFEFVEQDLLTADLPALLSGVDFVFHLAAQAGVRSSWGRSFTTYTHNNILLTQQLLEAVKGLPIGKFVYASSSSIYGNVDVLPVTEDQTPSPISPYGVSKLAGEHLCNLYFTQFNVPTVSLRYFTVYGPRHRPDMAFHRFIRAILLEQPITVYGDGNQTRDFTFVSDVVQATVSAMRSPNAGKVYNISGGSSATVNEVITLLEQILGQKAKVEYVARQEGDVRDTFADSTRARRELGYAPKVDLAEGLRREANWLKEALEEMGLLNREGSRPSSSQPH